MPHKHKHHKHHDAEEEILCGSLPKTFDNVEGEVDFSSGDERSSSVAPTCVLHNERETTPVIIVTHVSKIYRIARGAKKGKKKLESQPAKLDSSKYLISDSYKEGEEVKTSKKSQVVDGKMDGVRALRDIHMDPCSEIFPIQKGEFVMLRGPSGGGKTTLLNIFGTLDRPTEGSIKLFGNEITSKSTDTSLAKIRLEKIGFVFQTFNLLATMSAYENVELPMTILCKLSKKERHKRTKHLLQMVGLHDRMDHLPSELSGGEQQRVTIARALANEPQLLLLDEPTGDLDTKNTIEIMDMILRINVDIGTTCVMVTHNSDIECYADRIIYLEDGKTVSQALNEKKVALDYMSYLSFLNEREQGGGIVNV